MQSTKPVQDIQRVDPHYDWQAGEGIRAIEGLYVEDLNALPLDPWARYGGQGAFINLGTARGYRRAAYVVEIPPRESLKPQRHLFEEVVDVVSGRGATAVWNEADPDSKQVIEWQEAGEPPHDPAERRTRATGCGVSVHRPQVADEEE